MKIVAIGGGEIGRPRTKEKGGGYYPIETLSIDREVVRLTGKEHPSLLLLPTASGDSPTYPQVVKKYYGGKLGCKVNTLCLAEKNPALSEIRGKILGADIIYVGGGNTLFMLGRWKKLGVDKILKEAAKRDIVLAGVSAGAVCWFNHANSDSKKMVKEDAELVRIKGLGFLDLMACPHYDVESDRPPSLKRMVMQYGENALALDNCTALEVVDNDFRILKSRQKANAYLLKKDGERVVRRVVPATKDFKSLSYLLA